MFILFVFAFGVIVGLCARPVTRAVLLSMAEARYNSYQVEIDEIRARQIAAGAKLAEPVAARIRHDLTMAEHCLAQAVTPLRVDDDWRKASEQLTFAREYLDSAQKYLAKVAPASPQQ